MKILHYFPLLFGFLYSCQFSETSESDNQKENPRHTLVFIDKSASLSNDENYQIQKYQDQVRLLVQEGIQREGDRIDVYFLHENTLKGKSLQLIAKTKLDDTQNLNPTDKESAELDFSLRLGKEKLDFEKKIMALIQEKNTSYSNQMTDISSSLTILNSLPTHSHAITAYYFSDMLESTRMGRDFHKQKPANSTEAKTWATDDAEKWKNISLHQVSIVMVLPFNPLASSQQNDPFVTLYWKTLFENLGSLSVEEL